MTFVYSVLIVCQFLNHNEKISFKLLKRRNKKQQQNNNNNNNNHNHNNNNNNNNVRPGAGSQLNGYCVKFFHLSYTYSIHCNLELTVKVPEYQSEQSK